MTDLSNLPRAELERRLHAILDFIGGEAEYDEPPEDEPASRGTLVKLWRVARIAAGKEQA